MMQNLKKKWLVVCKMTERIWQIFARPFTSLKIGTLVGSFYPKYRCVSLKFTEELCVMTMKKNAKFEEELTCFKIDMRSLMSFYPSTQKSQNLHFNGILLNKVYNVWVKKVQRNNVWWHWRLMQNLKENWHVLSKMTLGIWQIFTDWKIAISF